MTNSLLHKRLRRILTGIFKQMTDAHSAVPADGTLLPCPFCGDVPFVCSSDVRPGSPDYRSTLHYNHACINGRSIIISTTGNTKEECFKSFCKLWNTRYTPKDLAGSFAKRGAGDILSKFTLYPLNIPGNGKD